MTLQLEDETDARALLQAVRNQLRSSRQFNNPDHAESRRRLATLEQRLLDLLPNRGLTVL